MQVQFHTPQNEVYEYFDSLKNRIKELNAEDFFLLYDYVEILRATCHNEYIKLYYEYSNKVWFGEIDKLIPNTDTETLWRSVRCSVNTRRFQLWHKDHLGLFGPQKYREQRHKLRKILKYLTDFAFNEVVSIRLACTEIDIASRKWPNAIRATCHKGQKNERWPIGLKTYPEYYGSCKLLPYHGIPIVNRDRKGKPRLEIYPEVLLRGNNDLIRVTIDNTDEIYMYITEDVENEYNNGLVYSTPTGMRFCETIV